MANTGLAGPDRPPVLLFAPVVVAALGWAWLGYALLSERRVGRSESGPEPRPARVG